MSALEECRFPELAEPYSAALRAAVDFILERYRPLAIVAAGSILRGQGGPTSDLDIYVLHGEPWRQRVQRRFNGVPAEIFINPPQAVRRYFEDERRGGRPITADILSRGFPVYVDGPLLDELHAEAEAYLAAAPDLDEAALTWKRYMAADLLDNARDMVESDPLASAYFIYQALPEMLDFWFLAANRQPPRRKQLIAAVAALDPALGELVGCCYTTSDAAARFACAEQIAWRTLGAAGFFEWESRPEAVKADQAGL